MYKDSTALHDPTHSNMLVSMTPPVAPHLLTQLENVDSASIYTHGGVPGPMSMPPSKRPKLSLQTTALPTSYGSSSGATNHRVDNTTTTTPTTLNTFANTFELAVRPSPNSATASPAPFLPHTKARSLSPFCKDRPYDLNLPFGVKPILKDSSISYGYLHSSKPSTASPRVGRRVFFPMPKKVSFRPILEDEIVTYTYTARHVDLSTSEDDNMETDSASLHEELNMANHPEDSTIQREDDDGLSSLDTQTPLSDRICRKLAEKGCELDRGRSRQKRSSSAQRWIRRKRQWEWTLGELGDEDLSHRKVAADNSTEAPLQHEVKDEVCQTPQKQKSTETSTPCIAPSTSEEFHGLVSLEESAASAIAAYERVTEEDSPGASGLTPATDAAIATAQVDSGDAQQDIKGPESGQSP